MPTDCSLDCWQLHVPAGKRVGSRALNMVDCSAASPMGGADLRFARRCSARRTDGCSAFWFPGPSCGSPESHHA